MAVMWTKFYETSLNSDAPTTSANTWSQGFTAQNGTLEFLTLRYDVAFADNPVAASDLTAVISSVRIIVNGSVQHDFIAGFADDANDSASQYSYTLNKIGGRAVEVAEGADPTTRVGFINIPLGTVLNSQGQNRIECIVGWAETGTGATPTTTKLEWWGRYNDATQTGQILASSTTFQHSASAQEQVIVRCPTLLPAGAKISGLLILNDSNADEMSSQGVRINALSNFGLTPAQWRMVNGDLMNGVEFNAGSTSVTNSLTFKQGVDGSLLIPVFDLSLGDIAITVDNGSSATTRRYFPVITYPVGQKQMTEQRQSARVAGSSSKAILSNDLQ